MHRDLGNFALVTPILFAWTAASVTAQNYNPFPDPIPQSDFVIDVSDFCRAPGRINYLTSSPDGRVFFNNQLNTLYLVSRNGTKITRYLEDIRTYMRLGPATLGEQGFQSFAFHPNFVSPSKPGFGCFYVAITVEETLTSPTPDFEANGPFSMGDHVILEFRCKDPMAPTFIPADPKKPFREVLRIDGPYMNHTMGLIAFNPNASKGDPDFGLLYIAMGDGGTHPDTGHSLGLAGDPNTPYGTILRIDPLGTNSVNGKYGIPADNPFVAGGGLGEIFAYGFRNPQRFVWDREGNRRMFVADIGHFVVEEINIVVAGANYGWSQREGSFEHLANNSVGDNVRHDSASTGFTYPIAEYDHSEGNAITVGPVIRGGRIPELEGKLLFADFPRGRIFYLDADNPPGGGPAGITELRIRHNGVEQAFQAIIDETRKPNPSPGRSDLRFGTDRFGRIFLLNKHDGLIRVLGSADAPLAPPPSLKVVAPKRTKVRRARIQLTGSAADDGALRRVEYELSRSRGGYRTASGLGSWNFAARLRKGRNRIRVRAIDADGLPSPVERIVLLRR